MPAFFPSLLAVAGGGAAVASGVSAIPGRRGAIIGSRLALSAGDLGLVPFQRVADRCADIALSGGFITRLSRPISVVSRAIGVVEVVLWKHVKTEA